MDTVEIKQKVTELLNRGVSRTVIFNQLKGSGVDDDKLARIISSNVYQPSCLEQAGKINFLLFLMGFQILMTFVAGYQFGIKSGVPIIFANLSAFVPALLTYGFYHNRFWAYQAYIILAFIGVFQALKGLAVAPGETLVAILINLAALGFVWHIKSKIFPDLTGISVPKKEGDTYTFIN